MSRGKYSFFQFLTTFLAPKTHIEQIFFEFPKEELDLPPATNVRFTKGGVYDLDSDGDTHYVTETVYHEVADNLFSTINEQDQII
ncbi:MAG: hypothetical protein H8E73_07565 [Planctomycetes bacterium]|nr:hypothetical protein [Planctomycetota bacterium]